MQNISGIRYTNLFSDDSCLDMNQITDIRKAENLKEVTSILERIKDFFLGTNHQTVIKLLYVLMHPEEYDSEYVIKCYHEIDSLTVGDICDIIRISSASGFENKIKITILDPRYPQINMFVSKPVELKRESPVCRATTNVIISMISTCKNSLYEHDKDKQPKKNFFINDRENKIDETEFMNHLSSATKTNVQSLLSSNKSTGIAIVNAYKNIDSLIINDKDLKEELKKYQRFEYFVCEKENGDVIVDLTFIGPGRERYYAKFIVNDDNILCLSSGPKSQFPVKNL